MWFKRLNPFYKPTHCECQVDEYGIHYIIKIDRSKYRAMVRRKGLAFWDLVFELGYEEVRKMHPDKFWEAYSALEKISDEVKRKGGESSA